MKRLLITIAATAALAIAWSRGSASGFADGCKAYEAWARSKAKAARTAQKNARKWGRGRRAK